MSDENRLAAILKGATAKTEPKDDLPSKDAKPKARDGLKAFTFYAPPELQKILKTISLEQGKSQKELHLEAMDWLLRKYGKDGL